MQADLIRNKPSREVLSALGDRRVEVAENVRVDSFQVLLRALCGDEMHPAECLVLR